MSTRGHHGLLLGGGNPAAGFLDGLAVTPSCVLSLRKAISTATVAIRVRRSNDNAEQDIGFSATSAFASLDTTALASFVGANSAYVTTFYDQTGNGNHAVQATAANQAQIVNAGSYLGRLTFDGSNDTYTIPSLPQGSQYAGIYAKLKQSNAASFKMMFESGADGQTTSGALAAYISSTNTQWVMAAGNTGGGRATAFTVSSMSVLGQRTFLYNRSATGLSETRLFVSGAEQVGGANANNDQSGNFSALDMHIGARTGSSLYADMWLETAAFYNADTSSIRSSIEALVA